MELSFGELNKKYDDGLFMGDFYFDNDNEDKRIIEISQIFRMF